MVARLHDLEKRWVALALAMVMRRASQAGMSLPSADYEWYASQVCFRTSALSVVPQLSGNYRLRLRRPVSPPERISCRLFHTTVH